MSVLFKIDGENAFPEDVEMSELAYYMTQLELYYKEFISHKYSINKKEILISMTCIKKGSTNLDIKSKNYNEQLIEVNEEGAKAIRQGNLSLIPSEARSYIINIQDYKKYKNKNRSYKFGNEKGEILAEINHSTQFNEIKFTEGETTVYGRLISIDEEKNQARIRSVNGKSITCKINEEIGKELTKFFYKKQELAFEGLAQWNIDTWKIENLRVNHFYSLENSDLGESLLDFSEQFGKHWVGGSMEEFMEKIK